MFYRIASSCGKVVIIVSMPIVKFNFVTGSRKPYLDTCRRIVSIQHPPFSCHHMTFKFMQSVSVWCVNNVRVLQI